MLAVVCLQSDYVCSRRAFGTVSDFELYALTFSQSFKTIGLDCREVYEHVFAAVFRSNGFKTLAEGQRVEFEITNGAKGPSAANVSAYRDTCR